jgi:hypothetical protein
MTSNPRVVPGLFGLPVKFVLDLSDQPQPLRESGTNLFWSKELLEEFL